MIGPFRRSATRTGEVIRFVLIAQLAMGGWLVWNDLGPTLDKLPRLFEPAAPQITVPTAPGDQTRRYAPATMPMLQVPPGTRRFPQSYDMPDALRFEPDPDNRSVARLTGAIADGDAARFADWLKVRSEPPDKVYLNSPGGIVTEALALGRLLRERGIATAVEPGDICLSACPYAFAGGVLRDAPEGALIGLHQHYYGENTVLPAFMAVRDIQRGQAAVMAYLSEMGIDLRVMQPALSTPPEDIYILTPQELERYRLTRRDDPP